MCGRRFKKCRQPVDCEGEAASAAATLVVAGIAAARPAPAEPAPAGRAERVANVTKTTTAPTTAAAPGLDTQEEDTALPRTGTHG